MTGMVSPTLSPPSWIDTRAALEKMTADLQKYQCIAVDTESNSLHAYQERVCLLQFSTPDTDYLLDPFAFSSLEMLGPVFADPDIEKIFHASEYDIICLKRDYGFTFTNIFDTMLAARILGIEAVGLGSLLEAEFGLSLDKRYQRANWGKRPIEEPLLEYARMDTHYLILLREELFIRLETAGLLELAREDFQRMTRVLPPQNNTDDSWRIPGCQHLDPTQRAVLYALWQYRDRAAKKTDQPHFKVLSNQVLLDTASALPRSRRELLAVKGFNDRMADRHADGVLRAVESGLQSPPINQKQNGFQKPPEDYLNRIDKLRNWRRDMGLKMKVESDVVLPRDMLEKIAAAAPKTMQELATVMDELPWRYKRFGEKILNLIH